MTGVDIADVRRAVAEAEAKGAAARSILESPLVSEAFARLEAGYHSQFANSAPENTDAREAAYWRLRALTELRADLESVMSSGKLLAHNNRTPLRRHGKTA